MNAALKIPVAGKDRGGHQTTVRHRLRDFRRQRPAVPDAGCAAIAHQIETNSGERVEQPRGLEILRHHL